MLHFLCFWHTVYVFFFFFLFVKLLELKIPSCQHFPFPWVIQNLKQGSGKSLHPKVQATSWMLFTDMLLLMCRRLHALWEHDRGKADSWGLCVSHRSQSWSPSGPQDLAYCRHRVGSHTWYSHNSSDVGSRTQQEEESKAEQSHHQQQHRWKGPLGTGGSGGAIRQNAVGSKIVNLRLSYVNKKLVTSFSVCKLFYFSYNNMLIVFKLEVKWLLLYEFRLWKILVKGYELDAVY